MSSLSYLTYCYCKTFRVQIPTSGHTVPTPCHTVLTSCVCQCEGWGVLCVSVRVGGLSVGSGGGEWGLWSHTWTAGHGSHPTSHLHCRTWPTPYLIHLNWPIPYITHLHCRTRLTPDLTHPHCPKRLTPDLTHPLSAESQDEIRGEARGLLWHMTLVSAVPPTVTDATVCSPTNRQ